MAESANTNVAENNIKTYNNQEWEIKITLTNLSLHTEVTLVKDNINIIHLYNSLDCFSPKLRVTYNDFGFILTKFLKTTGLIMKVYIKSPQAGLTEAEKNKNPVFNGTFIINNVNIVSKQDETIIYEFIGELNNKTTLIKNYNYATNKETGKVSPYKIITDILQASNYPFDSNYTDTSQKIDFITSQNMTIEDSINYCLNLGVSKEDPPTYFVHNMLKGKAQLINQKSNTSSLVNAANVLSFYNKEDGAKNPNLATLITDIVSESPYGGLKNLQNLSTYEFNNYDHNKRQWKKYTYSGNLMSKTLANIQGEAGKDIENVFSPNELIDFTKLKQSYPNYRYDKMYDILKQLELGTDSIQFFVFGDLTRDAGQIVVLNTDNEKLYSNLNGVWLIYQVMHKWEDKTYTNDITCYRTMNMKPILNSEK